MLRNCIFSTHTTLTIDFARKSLESLLLYQKDKSLAWDNFFVYNTHPDEISNFWLVEFIKSLDVNNQIKNLEVIPYDCENSFKTLNQDVINQFEFLIDKGCLAHGSTLFLKSDYQVSENFNAVYNTFDETNCIWSLPIYNAKSKVSMDEINELRKLERFDPIPYGVYYRGGTNYPHTPGSFENIVTELSSTTFSDTHPSIRFVSHNIQNDYNLHVFTNDIINKCLMVANRTLKKNGVWGESVGSIPNLFNDVYYNEQVRYYSEIKAFGIHMYHGIKSKNHITDRLDERKIVVGEEY
jgi:hypothetical protein